MSCPACVGSAAVIRDCVDCLRADLASETESALGLRVNLATAEAEVRKARAEAARLRERVERMTTALECARPHCVNTSVEADIDEALTSDPEPTT